VFMREFPLGPSGKILKRELRELLKTKDSGSEKHLTTAH